MFESFVENSLPNHACGTEYYSLDLHWLSNLTYRNIVNFEMIRNFFKRISAFQMRGIQTAFVYSILNSLAIKSP